MINRFFREVTIYYLAWVINPFLKFFLMSFVVCYWTDYINYDILEPSSYNYIFWVPFLVLNIAAAIEWYLDP